MDEKKETYYLINSRLLGKKTNDDYYLFLNGEWKKDTEYLIMGKLCGYDEYEEEGSPYGWGSTSVMEEIQIISREEALELMNPDSFEKKR